MDEAVNTPPVCCRMPLARQSPCLLPSATAFPLSQGGRTPSLRRAYSYLELAVVMGILAVIFAAFMLWQRGYVRSMKDIEMYYTEREAILNRIELGQADNVTALEGLKRYEINWRGKKIVWLGN